MAFLRDGGEEIELPLEIWSLILSRRPLDEETWLGLASCSKRMRRLVASLEKVQLATCAWPQRLLALLRSPAIFRFTESHGKWIRVPHLDEIDRALKAHEEAFPEVAYHLHRPIRKESEPKSKTRRRRLRRRVDEDDSEEEDEDEAEEEEEEYDDGGDDDDDGSDDDDDDEPWNDSSDSDDDDFYADAQEASKHYPARYQPQDDVKCPGQVLRRHPKHSWVDHGELLSRRLAHDFECDSSEHSEEEYDDNRGEHYGGEEMKKEKYILPIDDEDANARNDAIWLNTLRAHQRGLSIIALSLGIPSTLSYLEINLQHFPAALLPPTLQTAILRVSTFQHDLRPFPRSLTRLAIYQARSAHGCPKNLTDLSWESHYPSKHLVLSFLPSCLMHLHFPQTISPKECQQLSPQIRRLSMRVSTWKSSDLMFLPRWLTSVNLSTAALLTPKCFKYLPSTLKALQLPRMEIEEEDVLRLPRGLTSLSASFTSTSPLGPETFFSLPEGLRRYPEQLPAIFRPSYAHHLMKRFPADWLEFEWPRYLSRYLPAYSCESLPRTMRNLEVDGLDWTGPPLGQLPPLLEKLTLRETRTFGYDDGRLLPEHLVSFTLPRAVTTSLLMGALPKSLTELSIGLLLLNQPAIAISTSAASGTAFNFPPLLTRLSLNCSFGDATHFKALPKGLTHLHLDNCQLRDGWVSSLPRSLLYLCMPTDQSLSDAGIPEFPVDLRTLDLPSNNLITDAGFAVLPRGLLALSLPQNTLATDAGVPGLPRTLYHINLIGNRNFTALSLSYWPPDMEAIDVNIGDVVENKETPVDRGGAAGAAHAQVPLDDSSRPIPPLY